MIKLTHNKLHQFNFFDIQIMQTCNGNRKIVLGCGTVAFIIVIALVAGDIWLLSGPESGVKLSNEMDQYALQYLSEHNLLIPTEDLIAYYDVTMKMDGTEAAILTTKRVIYHKDGKSDAIELSTIEDIQHRNEPLIGDIIEIHASSGRSMKVEIAPLNQDETCRSSLMRAWQNAKTSRCESEPSAPADGYSPPLSRVISDKNREC